MADYSLTLTSGIILVSPYQYATDEDGNHIIDEDGKYVVTDSSFDIALSLKATRKLSVASGAITLAGTGVSLGGKLRLNISYVAFTVVGTKVDFVYVAGPMSVYYDLVITSGHFIIAGRAIQFSRSLGLLASKKPSITSQTTKYTFH